MKQNGILAVDIGTSSIRVSMFTMDDGIKDMWKQSHSLNARFSADSLWNNVKQLIQKATKAYPNIEISSIAISSFLGWVVVDSKGKPVELAWSWMAHAEEYYVNEVLEKLPENTDVTIGRKPSKDLTALLWGDVLRKNPEAVVLSFKDYCINKLTGTFKMDRTHASYTGLLSIKKREWDSYMTGQFGIAESNLPELGNGEDIVAYTGEKMSRELGLSAAVPVVLSGPDGTMAVLGSGGVSPGKTVEVMGTTDVFFHVQHHVDNKNLYDQGLVQNCFLDADLYGIGGPMGMTGGTLDWFMQEWKLSYEEKGFQEILQQWNSLKAAEDGLYVIPMFTGARVPDWNPAVRGTVVGMKPEHSQMELYKAAVEGIALLTARLRKKLLSFLDIGDEMIAIGGGAKNNILLKTRASTSNCIMLVPKEIEASTVGAIILAGTAVGFYSSLENGIQQLNPIKEKIIPDQKDAEKYLPLLEDYEALISHMNGWYN